MNRDTWPHFWISTITVLVFSYFSIKAADQYNNPWFYLFHVICFVSYGLANKLNAYDQGYAQGKKELLKHVGKLFESSDQLNRSATMIEKKIDPPSIH